MRVPFPLCHLEWPCELILIICGIDFQIRAEAAYLYDAVLLYAHALRDVLLEGGDPYDGLAIMEHIRGRTYMSAMG